MNRRHLFALLAGAAVAPMVPAASGHYERFDGWRIAGEAEEESLFLDGMAQTVATSLYYGGEPIVFTGFETLFDTPDRPWLQLDAPG